MNIIFNFPKTEEGMKEFQKRINEQYTRMYIKELQKYPADVQQAIIDKKLKKAK